MRWRMFVRFCFCAFLGNETSAEVSLAQVFLNDFEPHPPPPPGHGRLRLWAMDSTPNMTGRRFHRTMKMIPRSPGSLKAFLFPTLLSKVQNKWMQGARAIERGTSFIRSHCPAPRSSSQIWVAPKPIPDKIEYAEPRINPAHAANTQEKQQNMQPKMRNTRTISARNKENTLQFPGLSLPK